MIRIGDEVIIVNSKNQDLIGVVGKVVLINNDSVAIKTKEPITFKFLDQKTNFITSQICNVEKFVEK